MRNARWEGGREGREGEGDARWMREGSEGTIGGILCGRWGWKLMRGLRGLMIEGAWCKELAYSVRTAEIYDPNRQRDTATTASGERWRGEQV